MSAFTSQGFEPIETPGSRHTDGLYREHRQRGFDEAGAIHHVFSRGYAAGSGRPPQESPTDSVTTSALYRNQKVLGLTHGEALDEVFLQGYEVGKANKHPVYDRYYTREELSKLLWGGDK